MNVGEIKKAVAAYLEKPVADFSKNGVDLLLIATNNARKFAERMHDFAHLHAYGKLILPSGESGVALSAATDTSDVAVSVKTLLNVYRRYDGGDLPLSLMEKSALTYLQRESNERTMWDSDTIRAMADYDTSPNQVLHRRIFRHGNTLYLHPVPSEEIELRIDYVGWASDYTGDTSTDFFTESAQDYMIFQSIVEVNHFTGTFAYRAEGSLAPPEKIAERLLQAVIDQDKSSLDDGITPELY